MLFLLLHSAERNALGFLISNTIPASFLLSYLMLILLAFSVKRLVLSFPPSLPSFFSFKKMEHAFLLHERFLCYVPGSSQLCLFVCSWEGLGSASLDMGPGSDFGEPAVTLGRSQG